MKVIISGSFKRHLNGILRLKRELETRGIHVIKPDKINTIKKEDIENFLMIK